MEKGEEKKKLEIQKMYQPTRDEYAALHYLAIALRPEWKNHPPGQKWANETQDRTFPHAENFEHCLKAITDYCTASKNGKPTYRFPTLFPGDGDHWRKTLPIKSRVKKAPCADHPENDGGETNCTQCWADIKAGQRPRKYLGERYENHETAA